MISHPFVCIEGLDGVGKTTVSGELAQRLGARYHKAPLPRMRRRRLSEAQLHDCGSRKTRGVYTKPCQKGQKEGHSV
jgi:thymidylate kinase